jgi:hypothetical protein
VEDIWKKTVAVCFDCLLLRSPAKPLTGLNRRVPKGRPTRSRDIARFQKPPTARDLGSCPRVGSSHLYLHSIILQYRGTLTVCGQVRARELRQPVCDRES